MRVVAYLLQAGKENEARDAVIDLTEIAEREPILFKPHFKEHTSMLLQVANNGNGQSNFDSETRQAALELVISVVENKAALIRKDSALLLMLCETLMQLLLGIEDTEEWHKAVEEQDLDDGVLPLPLLMVTFRG
jgi:heterodisulfide reductase subunit C